MRGYHPLLAVAAGLGDVLHTRLRGGRSTSGRGAAGFLAETFARVRAAGFVGALTVRADSGFYAAAVTRACRRAGARVSITVILLLLDSLSFFAAALLTNSVRAVARPAPPVDGATPRGDLFAVMREPFLRRTSLSWDSRAWPTGR